MSRTLINACAIMGLIGYGVRYEVIRMAKRRRTTTKTVRTGAIVSLMGLFVLIGTLVGMVAGYLKSAPSLDQVQFRPEFTTYIYDIHGKVIARLYRENRVPVKLSQIPEALQLAVIATEDVHFYEHHGVNISGIIRALLVNAKEGDVVQGGSTITQQLAKTAFLTNERTIARKLKELLWAIQIERKYSKEEILETYLNEIYFNHGAYGVEAAAQTYFGKSVGELTLAESALLAGIPKGPSYYSPFVDLDAATRRRNVVLGRLLELGYISRDQAARAKSEPIRLGERKANRNKAPYFVDYLLSQLLTRYSEDELYTGGLRIYTTLDIEMQKAAESALLERLPKGRVDGKGLTQPQGAIVALEPNTGQIRAMMGGRGEDKFNRSVQAVRQPGSAIKPFIYIAAIDSGFTPATVMVDEPITYPVSNGEPWAPKNYDNVYRGYMTLREALENSVNTVSVKLLDKIGVRQAIAYAKKMGISTIVEKGSVNDVNLSFALGGLTNGVTPLELAAAYGALANQGIYVEPISILRVVDHNGIVLEERATRRRVVLPEATAYVATDMMRGVIERGTGRSAYIGRPAAGKTGTTSDYTNAWFVGFTPDLVAAVWIGEDLQARRMVYRGTAIPSSRAALIWSDFMRSALAGIPARDFPKPTGVVDGILIDTETGLLATAGCPSDPSQRRYEIFVSGTEPTHISPRCGGDDAGPPQTVQPESELPMEDGSGLGYQTP